MHDTIEWQIKSLHQLSPNDLFSQPSTTTTPSRDRRAPTKHFNKKQPTQQVQSIFYAQHILCRWQNNIIATRTSNIRVCIYISPRNTTNDVFWPCCICTTDEQYTKDYIGISGITHVNAFCVRQSLNNNNGVSQH